MQEYYIHFHITVVARLSRTVYTCAFPYTIDIIFHWSNSMKRVTCL